MPIPFKTLPCSWVAVPQQPWLLQCLSTSSAVCSEFSFPTQRQQKKPSSLMLEQSQDKNQIQRHGTRLSSPYLGSILCCIVFNTTIIYGPPWEAILVLRVAVLGRGQLLAEEAEHHSDRCPGVYVPNGKIV